MSIAARLCCQRGRMDRPGRAPRARVKCEGSRSFGKDVHDEPVFSKIPTRAKHLETRPESLDKPSKGDRSFARIRTARLAADCWDKRYAHRRRPRHRAHRRFICPQTIFASVRQRPPRGHPTRFVLTLAMHSCPHGTFEEVQTWLRTSRNINDLDRSRRVTRLEPAHLCAHETTKYFISAGR